MYSFDESSYQNQDDESTDFFYNSDTEDLTLPPRKIPKGNNTIAPPAPPRKLREDDVAARQERDDDAGSVWFPTAIQRVLGNKLQDWELSSSVSNQRPQRRYEEVQETSFKSPKHKEPQSKPQTTPQRKGQKNSADKRLSGMSQAIPVSRSKAKFETDAAVNNFVPQKKEGQKYAKWNQPVNTHPTSPPQPTKGGSNQARLPPRVKALATNKSTMRPSVQRLGSNDMVSHCFQSKCS